MSPLFHPTAVAIAAITTMLALASGVSAQVPDLIPVQGYLTDAEGVALEGAVEVFFVLYESVEGEAVRFRERQTLMVEDGFFSTELGAIERLDLSVFDNGGVGALGITVGVDEEMRPRIALGSVPYAAFARRAESAASAETLGGQSVDELLAAAVARAIPTGTVMHFDLPRCPEGWSSFSPAVGRTIVGSAGTGLGMTVGTSLRNGEDRMHTHSVNPASINTTVAGRHSHTVDPSPFNSGGPSVTTLRLSHGSDTWAAQHTHVHTIDVPSTSSSLAGDHSHRVDIPATTSTGARTSDVIPYVQLLACRRN